MSSPPNRTISIAMPMPMPSSSLPSSPKPSAPENPPNEFTKFFKSEDVNSQLPYPTIRQHFYYLRLDIKRDWNAGYAHKDSPNFTLLASEMEIELKSLFGGDDSFKISMIHAQKDRWSSRRILLTFVVQTIVNFAVEKLEVLLKQHIKNEEKISLTRAYLRDLKVRKIQNIEYEHLMNYGCNPCTTCDHVLKKHRKLDVNNPSSVPDILCFLVVMLSFGLVVAILLLIFIK